MGYGWLAVALVLRRIRASAGVLHLSLMAVRCVLALGAAGAWVLVEVGRACLDCLCASTRECVCACDCV